MEFNRAALATFELQCAYYIRVYYHVDENLAKEDYVFEKTQSFKYLGATITGNNDWCGEICDRINKGERAYFALIK